MPRVIDLTSFFDFLLDKIGKAKLSDGNIPGMDQVYADKLADSAGEWIILTIVQNHLPKSEQELYRDCRLSAPEIFDAAEFLYDSLPSFNSLLEIYTSQWIEKTRVSMSK